MSDEVTPTPTPVAPDVESGHADLETLRLARTLWLSANRDDVFTDGNRRASRVHLARMGTVIYGDKAKVQMPFDPPRVRRRPRLVR